MTNIAKYKLTIILISFIVISCGQESMTRETQKIDLKKYKGSRILKRLETNYGDREYYIIRNDTTIIELRVPKWFSSIYKIGDTIQ